MRMLMVAALPGLRMDGHLCLLKGQRRLQTAARTTCVCCKRPFAPHAERLTGPALRHKQQARHIAARAVQVPVEYDAKQNAAYWETRPVPVTARLLHIGWEFGRWWVGARTSNNAQAAAANMRELLVRLGPAFVKIGQALSSRPDVMPPDYLRELEKLQDRIPPFPSSEAFQVMREELGVRQVSDIFSELSVEPVAAASLGQVYRAKLRRSGQEVAVKVQRPGVLESIAMDVFILRLLAEVLRRWGKFNTDLPALVDEWATSLFKELDYTREASNAQRFKQLFAHMPNIYVPVMYMENTTPRVLTMEWVEGVRVHTNTNGAPKPLAPSDRTANLALVEVGVQCSLEQMLEEGFYHADPHPGNVLRMTGGRLAYLDFGMMGSIDRPVRQGLMRATLHLVNREFAALAEDFVTLGLLPEGADRSQVVPPLTAVFEEALRGGVQNLSFGSLSSKLGQTMYEYKFRIPPYYTLLVRSLTVLEGIALVSDPNYKVLGAAYPWVARRLLTDRSPEMRETLDALLYKGGRFQFKRLESLLEQAARSPARPTPARAASVPGTVTVEVSSSSQAATIAATPAAAPGSRTDGNSALGLILSEDGAAVREILVEELAKGLDAVWRLALDEAVASTRERFRSLLVVERPVGTSAVMSTPALASGALDSLLSLPTLADEDDKEQVEGIVRLTGLMMNLASSRQAAASQLPNEPASSKAATSAAASPHDWSIQQAAHTLNWFVQEMQVLPDSARQEALRIPISLAAKVSSRVAARAIRSAFGGR